MGITNEQKAAIMAVCEAIKELEHNGITLDVQEYPQTGTIKVSFWDEDATSLCDLIYQDASKFTECIQKVQVTYAFM